MLLMTTSIHQTQLYGKNTIFHKNVLTLVVDVKCFGMWLNAFYCNHF